jgi:alkyl sulfatase BDS1-like metallo-beta-lactamase superfamily hydrolase
MYRYINDQTLRMANEGLTRDEIAANFKLPDSPGETWANRGYYGSVSHVKATYVLYLGWFDGNPATLDELPPEEAAKKFVDYMGGADAILQKAKEDYNQGNYRWVAQVTSKIVFADPGNLEARNLEADALEQLGYQAESGPWRNFYLTGAQELRNGVRKADAEYRQPGYRAGHDAGNVFRLSCGPYQRRKSRNRQSGVQYRPWQRWR